MEINNELQGINWGALHCISCINNVFVCVCIHVCAFVIHACVFTGGGCVCSVPGVFVWYVHFICMCGVFVGSCLATKVFASYGKGVGHHK